MIKCTDDRLLGPPIVRKIAVIENGLRDADSVKTVRSHKLRANANEAYPTAKYLKPMMNPMYEW